MNNFFLVRAFCFLLPAMFVAQPAAACDREVAADRYVSFELDGSPVRIPVLATPLSAAEQSNAPGEDDIVAIFRDVLASYGRHANDVDINLVAVSATSLFSNGPGWRLRVSAFDARRSYTIVLQHRLHAGTLEFLPVEARLQSSPEG